MFLPDGIMPSWVCKEMPIARPKVKPDAYDTLYHTEMQFFVIFLLSYTFQLYLYRNVIKSLKLQKQFRDVLLFPHRYTKSLEWQMNTYITLYLICQFYDLPIQWQINLRCQKYGHMGKQLSD